MSTLTNTHRTYTFGRFSLDTDRGVLIAGGQDIKLRPKSFQMLQYLIERHGHLVSKDHILDAIWGSTVVTDDSVTQCLVDIRRALDDRSQEMIRTIPRRGYIFETPVTFNDGTTSPLPVQTRSRLVSGWPGWRIAAAFLLLFGGAVVLWNLAARVVDEPVESDTRPQLASYSVAVLPFLDLSPDRNLAYFAEGISEEILNLLTKVKDLRVIARTSSFSFKEHTPDIATIKAKLAVSHVLEGSVRQSEDTIRITVQLVDATSSEHIWSETYDREMSDVFAIQDEIAAEVLKRLATSLSIELPKVRATNAEAFRLYLQAVHIIDQLDFSKNAEAESIMRQALELDPNFAPAWRELGRILWRQIGDGPNIEEDIAQTWVTLQKALDIEPNDAATLAYMGWHVVDFGGDISGGARMLERALSYEPSNENVLRTATLFAHAFGQSDDAVRLGEFSVSRNPLCYPCYVQLATAYQNAGRLDDAESTLRKMQSLFDRDNGRLGMVKLLKAQPEQALAVYSEEQSEDLRLFGKTLALHSLGRLQGSANALTRYLEIAANESYWRIVQAYAWTEQPDAAFATIDKAARQSQLYVDGRIVRWNLQAVAQAARHPVFRRLHDDPRWDVFLDRYGISAEKIAAVNFSVDLPDWN